MSRYIDADAIMEHAEQYLKIYNDMYEAMESGYTDEERDAVDAQRCTATEFVALIHNAPTVDAVPVVRCRECKWAEVDAWWTYCKLGHKEDTTNSIIYTCTHDFYCADGERRTE
jgi:hypothetical protein